MLVMASVSTFVGIANQEYLAIALGGLFLVVAVALARFDYQIYLDAQLWSYHKRVATWGLTVKREDRELSLHDEHGECPVKFDRASRQKDGYRLGFVADDYSVIWLDLKGHRGLFLRARNAAKKAWRQRVAGLDHPSPEAASQVPPNSK